MYGRLAQGGDNSRNGRNMQVLAALMWSMMAHLHIASSFAKWKADCLHVKDMMQAISG